MAKTRNILAELSGTLAGNVFSHNKGGTYIRAHAVPTNPNKLRQQLVRQRLAQASGQWNALTVAQRAAWNLWASLHSIVDALGSTIYLSGHGAYCMLAASALNTGDTPVTDPPAGVGPAPLFSAVVAIAQGTLAVVTFTASPLLAGTRLCLLASPPGNVGRDPNFRTARFLGASAVATSSPTTIATGVNYTSGQVVNFWLRMQDTVGRRSPESKVRLLIP